MGKKIGKKKELLPIDFYRLSGYYLYNGSGELNFIFTTIPIIKLYFLKLSLSSCQPEKKRRLDAGKGKKGRNIRIFPPFPFSRVQKSFLPMRARLTKDFRFESAQTLPKLPPGHKCAQMHGHSFLMEISVEGEVKLA
ncbi:MAG: 6-pyruvoyl trahydropterin synthase family protein, partial [Microcoleus sp.]